MTTTTTHRPTVLPLLALALAVAFSQQLRSQTRVVTFTTERAVMLRWIDRQDAEVQGYHIYRSDAGSEWKRVTPTPLTRVVSEAEIERVAGFKTDLYLGLFGVDRPRDLTEADYRRTLVGEDAGFLRLMLLTNPEFGELMGQLYRDSLAPSGADVRYRIVELRDGTEREVASTGTIQVGAAQSVPPVEEIDALPGDESATISWHRDPQTLDTGSVVGYNVYRAESVLGPFMQMNALEIAPISLRAGEGDESDRERGMYRDRWLQNGRTYYYHIRSVNLFGIESAPSVTVEVTPQEDTPPSPPASLAVTRTGDHLALSWSAPSVLGVEIYRGTSRAEEFSRVFAVAPASGLESETGALWIDNDVRPGREYLYFARTTNTVGLKSLPSDTLSYFMEDRTPPAPPVNVEAVGAKEGITIRWKSNTEDDLLGYVVERAEDATYRTRSTMTDRPTTGTSWRDDVSSTSETTYGYVVYAIDKSYNRSAPSRMVFGRMPDIVPPQRPIITGLAVERDTVMLDWTPAPQPDLAGYSIYRSRENGAFERIGRVESNVFEEMPVADGTYRYAVSAIDSAGNESDRSEPGTIRYARDRRPLSPSSVAAEAKHNHILVTWSAVETAAGYVLYRVDPATGRSLLLAEPKAGETAFKDRHSDRTKEHVYVVQARDGEWRMSAEAKGKYVPERN